MMQCIVQQLVASAPRASPSDSRILSTRELNVIRYIAGYVIYKMKKFPDSFGLFEKAIETNHTYGVLSSVDDYTRVWVEQVNRGGLYIVMTFLIC